MKVPAVTNLHEVYRKTPPGRFQGSHNGSQPVTTGHKLPTGPKRQHIPPVTAGHKCLRGPRPSASRPPRGVANARGAAAPARSARLNAPRMPTGPQPQNILPVTTGHERPQVLSPGALRPSQQVTNCPRGLSPSVFRPSQLVTNAHGAPPPARTTRHGPPSLGAIRRSRRGTRAYGARPQSVLPATTGHKHPRGPTPSASRSSERAIRAHGA